MDGWMDVVCHDFIPYPYFVTRCVSLSCMGYDAEMVWWDDWMEQCISLSRRLPGRVSFQALRRRLCLCVHPAVGDHQRVILHAVHLQTRVGTWALLLSYRAAVRDLP